MAIKLANKNNLYGIEHTFAKTYVTN